MKYYVAFNQESRQLIWETSNFVQLLQLDKNYKATVLKSYPPIGVEGLLKADDRLAGFKTGFIKSEWNEVNQW